MIYVQLVLFSVFTALSFGSFGLIVWQRKPKAVLLLGALAILFLYMAGMSWPHHVVTS